MSSKCSKLKLNREPPNKTRLARESATITSFPWSVVLSTNQNARNRSVLVKAIIDITDQRWSKCSRLKYNREPQASVSLQSFQSPKVQFDQLFFFFTMASRDTRACKSLRQLASATNNFVCFGRTKICGGTAQRRQAEATIRFVCTDNLCRHVKLFALAK